MAGKDIYRKPFDEGTQHKLYLYKKYVQEWLPVFLNQKIDRVQVFDFFAGRGRDNEGELGSPLIALEEIKNAICAYRQPTPPPSVHLYLNEYKTSNYDDLMQHCESFPDKECATIHYANLDFKDAFAQWMPLMQDRHAASLVFFDQNGVKQITPKVFKTIVSIPRTDFLFFISSSFANRFRDDPNIVGSIPFTKEDLAMMKGHNVHRVICNAYRRLLPDPENYYLAPFSIKKGGNVYGLIFGSGHPLGMEKFIKSAWKIDPVYGEADYDIDDEDIRPERPSLFPDMDKPTKKKKFEDGFRHALLSGEFPTTMEAYLYTIREGFPPDAARDILKELRDDGYVAQRYYPISYDCSFKDRDRIVSIEVTGKGRESIQ